MHLGLDALVLDAALVDVKRDTALFDSNGWGTRAEIIMEVDEW